MVRVGHGRRHGLGLHLGLGIGLGLEPVLGPMDLDLGLEPNPKP